MDFKDYSEQASRTRSYPEDWKIVYPILKLNGEAGECAELIGKIIRGDWGKWNPEIKSFGPFGNPELTDRFLKELGDVLWYIDAAAQDVGSTLEEVAELNIKKLKDRKERNVIKGSGDER